MDSLTSSRPTFYELCMQERLAGLLSTAVQFTLGTVSNHYTKLTQLRYYLAEATAVIVGAIDYYYLRKTGGTHSEQFYGLQRTLKPGVWDKIAVVLLTFGPKVLLKRLLGDRFQTLETAYSMLKASFMLSYLYFRGDYYSPDYFLLGHKLQRNGLTTGLQLGIFVALLLLKAAEFWFQSAGESQATRVVGPVPAMFSASQVPVNLCGLCRKAMCNPTALDVSGYVFCYSCIKQHVDTFGNCPVTGEKASVGSLRKVRR